MFFENRSKDYYPFGMEQPNRQYSQNQNYRYGFNSQEKSEELGNGIYTAEFWEYDSKIARRWNRDPVVKEHESPYTTFSDNPIWFADHNGADTIIFHKYITYDNRTGKIRGSDNIELRLAEGEDVFFYKTTNKIYNDKYEDPLITTTTKQFYPLDFRERRSGITKSDYWLSGGLLSAYDDDQTTLAKLAPPILLDYLIEKSVGMDRKRYVGTKAKVSTGEVFEIAKAITEVTLSAGEYGLGIQRIEKLLSLEKLEFEVLQKMIKGMGGSKAKSMNNLFINNVVPSSKYLMKLYRELAVRILDPNTTDPIVKKKQTKPGLAEQSKRLNQLNKVLDSLK